VPDDAVGIAWAAPATRLNVRADTAAAGSVGMALGVLLGSAPCRAMITRARTALWLGPDEWLVLAADTDPLPLTAGAALASVVDVSHGWLGIVVSGPRAAWCINAFNALDLDPAAFPPGACTRTLFGKAPVVLWRVAAAEFRLEVARSLAPYVWQCLQQSAHVINAV
jgi:heterotetrameric sarcosine oxidase gamma subunit